VRQEVALSVLTLALLQAARPAELLPDQQVGPPGRTMPPAVKPDVARGKRGASQLGREAANRSSTIAAKLDAPQPGFRHRL
jgi:hypothetical protein